MIRIESYAASWINTCLNAYSSRNGSTTEDNIYQTEKMKKHGIFSNVNQEVGEIIVADVNQPRIDELLAYRTREALGRLIRKED